MNHAYESGVNERSFFRLSYFLLLYKYLLCTFSRNKMQDAGIYLYADWRGKKKGEAKNRQIKKGFYFNIQA